MLYAPIVVGYMECVICPYCSGYMECVINIIYRISVVYKVCYIPLL